MAFVRRLDLYELTGNVVNFVCVSSMNFYQLNDLVLPDQTRDQDNQMKF